MAYTSLGLPILDVSDSADDNYSAVTLALFDDWQKNYSSFRDQQFEFLTTENPGIVDTEVAEATSAVDQSYEAAKTDQAVTMSRLGMSPDQQTQDNIDRNSALSKAAAKAAAANTTRQSLKERDMLIMTGVPNVAGRSYGMSGE